MVHSFAGFVNNALRMRVALTSKMFETCLMRLDAFAAIYKYSLKANKPRRRRILQLKRGCIIASFFFFFSLFLGLQNYFGKTKHVGFKVAVP